MQEGAMQHVQEAVAIVIAILIGFGVWALSPKLIVILYFG